MERVAVERQDLHPSAHRIDDPVLTDASAGIERSLGQHVMAAIRGAENFDEEIGRAFRAAQCQVPGLAGKDHDDVWLNWISALEENIQRRCDQASAQR